MSKDITHHAALPKKTTLNLMKRLVKTYLAPYWVSVLTALLFMALAAAMTAAVAQLMQPILDEVLNGKKTDMILPVAAVILTVFILRGISTYAHTIMMNKVGQSIVADIQKDRSSSPAGVSSLSSSVLSTGLDTSTRKPEAPSVSSTRISTAKP